MTSNISRQGSECVRLWRCLCVRVCECCIAHTDPCLSGHILSISLCCRSLFALAATGLLGFRCEGSNRVRSHVRVRACVHSWRLSCVCVYSERVFVRVCVSSYFRHSHHGRLFLVLKDSVCMHVYMSTGICTHCADACVCACVRACVCVCVLAVDWRAGLGGCGEFVCSGPLVWKSSQSCASPWRESLI